MPSSESWRWRKHHMVAGGLALVGGYSDIISLHRWKCFTSMLTGNFLWLGRVLLGHSEDHGEFHGPVFYVCLILAFFLGAVLHRWAERTWPQRGATRVAPLLGAANVICEVCLLLLCESPQLKAIRWQVVLYSPLFGVVCTASADGRLGSPTLLVTGHVVNLSKVVVNWPFKAPTYNERNKAVMSGIIVVCTVLGAFVATVAFKLNDHSTVGLFVPVSPLLVFLLWCHDHLSRARSLVKMCQKAVRAKQQAGEQGTGGTRAESSEPTASPGDSSDEESESELEGEEQEENQDQVPVQRDLEQGVERQAHDSCQTVFV